MSLATMANEILKFAPGLNLDIIKSIIQSSYVELCSRDWIRLKLNRQITTVIPYSTGKVVIAPTGVVMGVGTTFASTMVGRFMRIEYADSLFEIDTYTSATQILLKDWTGAAIPATPVIVSSSVANPTLITTLTAHGFTTGNSIAINGHTGSTPALDGIHTVTVVSPTTFTVPVNVTVGGTGGVASLGQTYSILKTIYPVDVTFGIIFDIIYQTSLLKKSQSYFNKIDPARISSSSTPLYWAYAGEASTGALQVEIYPPPTSVVPLRVYGKMRAATLGDSDLPKLPEPLLEAYALIDCYELKDLQLPGQGWDKRKDRQEMRFGGLLQQYEDEDFQLDSHRDRVKDVSGDPIIPSDDNFSLSHDVD